MKQASAREKNDLWKVKHTHSLGVSSNQRDLWLKLLDTELKQSLKLQREHAVIRSPLPFVFCWGPFGDKFLDVRGIISKRQATGPSGVRLNPGSSLLQFARAKQKVFGCVGGGWKWMRAPLLNRAKTCWLTKGNRRNLSPEADENKHKHTQVGGLTFHPLLTGEGEVRFIFGRELSSPMGPLGLCSTSRRWKKLFLCCFLGFFSFALYFVLFFLLCSCWMAFRGTTGREEVFPKLISSTNLPESLTVCNDAFYLQIPSHVVVSSGHNTDCCTPVNLYRWSEMIYNHHGFICHFVLYFALHFTFLLIDTILNFVNKNKLGRRCLSIDWQLRAMHKVHSKESLVPRCHQSKGLKIKIATLRWKCRLHKVLYALCERPPL